MIDRSVQPPVNGFEGFSLNAPRHFRLSNGIPVYFFHNPQLDLIHISVRIKAGTLYEPAKRIASFCYELMRESHPTLSSAELDDFFDFYGCSVSVSVSIGCVKFNIQVPKKNCQKIVPVFCELLRNPRFLPENLERFREKSIKDFEYYAQKTDFRASQLMFNAYFGKDFTFGKILQHSDIENITIEQISQYQQRSCCAENITLFLTGSLDDDALAFVENEFSTLASGTPMPKLPCADRHFEPKRISEQWENAQQTSLVLCRPAVHFTDAENSAYRFLMTLYSNYFGSRLMQNLRESNGYTYGVSGSTLYYESGSLFMVETDVNNDKTEPALQACFDEMRRLNDELVSDEEMEIVRNYLLGSALRTIDGTVSYMQAYAVWNDFDCDESRFANYLDVVRTITPEQLQAMSRRLLRPEDYTVISVGAGN